jgi:hypothetical protein
MLDNMRRLYPRGAANRGICVDADGAMLGPDCVLVRRTRRGFRSIERDAASTLQKCVLDADHDQDWLFYQCGRIADALNNGEPALAQIYGLRIPIGDLEEWQLRRIARVGPAKAGFNPDEPRVPKGDSHGGEWTDGGGEAGGGDDLLGDSGAAGGSGDGTAGRDGGPDGAGADDLAAPNPEADGGGSSPMEYSIVPTGNDASSDRTPATAEIPSNGSDANAPDNPNGSSPILPAGTVAAADAAAVSLLGQLPTETIAALTQLAGRMTAATIVFRILFIPSNGSAVVEGNVVNAPDLSYRYNRDTGTVQVWQDDDGTGARTLLGTGHIGVDGRFYDDGGRVIGRTLSNAAVVDPDTLPGYRSYSSTDAGAATRPLAIADTADPKLCPDPTPENIAGRSDRTIAYQSQITGVAAGPGSRVQR